MSEHATPGGGPDNQVSVTVPSWAVTDWGAAGLVALRTVLTFVAVGVLVLVAMVLLVLIRFGSTGLDVGDLLGTAFSLPLVYLGAYEGTPVLLTGLVVLVFALKRSVRAVPLPAGDRVRMYAFAGKVAVVAVLMLVAIAILMDVLDLLPATGLGGGLGLIEAFRVDYVRLVFVAGPVIGVFALFQIARASGQSVMGSKSSGGVPTLVSIAWVGARRTLKISFIGLLVLFVVGSALELLSVDFGEFGRLVDALLTLVLMVVVFVAVDLAALFFVGAMSFLQYETLGIQSAWAWAGVALVAVAFFLGGREAAKRANPRTVTEALTAASLIGVLLAIIGALVAINYQGLGGIPGFAAPAILLPLLWTIPALAGAWWYANERGLPSGVAVSVSGQTAEIAVAGASSAPVEMPTGGSEPAFAGGPVDPGAPAVVADPPPVPSAGTPPAEPSVVPEVAEPRGPTSCQSCGASNPAGHSFCSSCGKPLT